MFYNINKNTYLANAVLQAKLIIKVIYETGKEHSSRNFVK